MPSTGFALIKHLVQQKNPNHLSVQLLTTVQHLLSDMQYAPDELCAGCRADVLRALLLDPGLWAAAAAPVQHHLHAACMSALEVRVLADAVHNHHRHRHPSTPIVILIPLTTRCIQEFPSLVSRALPPSRLLDALRWHYWAHPSPEASWQATKGTADACRELPTLRKGMLTIVRLLMDAAAVPTGPPPPGAPSTAPPLLTDTHALLAFVGDCPDRGMLEDVVGCLFAVTQPVAACGAATSQVVADAGGASLFLPLLRQPSKALQVLALRLIGQFGGTLNSGGALQSNPAGFWAAVLEAVEQLPLTVEIREALCEWLEGPLQCQVGCGVVGWWWWGWRGTMCTWTHRNKSPTSMRLFCNLHV